MSFFLKIDDVTTGLARRLAILFLIIAASLALYQVITRFVFGAPSTWSEVVTRSAMIWCVFMGVSVAFRHGAMISLEIVQRMLPPGRNGSVSDRQSAVHHLFCDPLLAGMGDDKPRGEPETGGD